ETAFGSPEAVCMNCTVRCLATCRASARTNPSAPPGTPPRAESSPAPSARRTPRYGVDLFPRRLPYPQIPRHERPHVGGLRDAFVGGHVAVAGLGFHAQQDRVVATLRVLQTRDELV